jgi:hypothetical protein
MRSRSALVAVAALSLVLGLMSGGFAAADDAGPAISPDGRDSTTVIAVVDGSFQPQHFNWHASRMPQHLDADPSNDLPLDQAPDTWLPGFPGAGAFASYNALPLALDDENPQRTVASLQQASPWSSVQRSTNSAVHYYWVPDTKVVGVVHFGTSSFQGTNTAHGAGTSSVAAGNLHGTCPECVVVLITYGGNDREAASNWAMRQPWIDVVTNSFGFSQVERERLYSGSDTALQKAATERGQTIFFSSGNGISNTFSVPNTTLFSSQEGPDWIVTVGGVAPNGGEYTGAGKPADVASVGSGYPSQYGGTTVSSGGNFSGTSNATPVVAGMYGRALWWARTQLGGPRQQDGGVLASGTPVACGAARPDCELGDGVLTATELRTRLLHAAVRTPQGLNPAGAASTPAKTDETELASEGHGTFFGRLPSAASWDAEQARITGPMEGTAAPLARTTAEREWMVVDSWCRQQIWGGWGGGYYVQGSTTLPGASPQWPVRTALLSTCGQLFPPVR